MTRIRFGSPRYARDLNEFAEWCEQAERVGLDVLGSGDSSTLWIDPFVALTVAAQHTKTARLVTTVTNPATRHPAVMASGFAGLQAASNGRAVMGIGGGDSALLNLGMRPPPLAYLENYVQAVRGLTAGEEVTWEGKKLKLQWPVQKTPVWVAANGAKTLRMAGRIADGVIVGLGVDEAAVRETLKHIGEGAREAGRRMEDIEIWWMIRPLISRTEREGWEQLRFLLCAVANHVFRFTFEGKGAPPELHGALTQLQKEYRPDLHSDYRHAGGHNAQLVDKLGLLEYLGRRFAVTGPPEQVAEGFKRIAGWGATNFLLIQVVEDRIGALKQMAEQVFPKVR